MRGTEYERGGTPPFLFLVRLLPNAGINRLADAPIGSSGLARNPPRFHDHYATSAGAAVLSLSHSLIVPEASGPAQPQFSGMIPYRPSFVLRTDRLYRSPR